MAASIALYAANKGAAGAFRSGAVKLRYAGVDNRTRTPILGDERRASDTGKERLSMDAAVLLIMAARNGKDEKTE